MSRPASMSKDKKDRLLTYSIVVRAVNKGNDIEEDFLELVYNFNQLAKLKHWNAEEKVLNTTILIECDLSDAFNGASFTDDDVRMDEEYTTALNKASVAVLLADHSLKLQEELRDMCKTREALLADYSKRFRAPVRQEHTLARLHDNSPMSDDELCRLYKRDLPYGGKTSTTPVDRFTAPWLHSCRFPRVSSKGSDASSVETSTIMTDIMDNATAIIGAIRKQPLHTTATSQWIPWSPPWYGTVNTKAMVTAAIRATTCIAFFTVPYNQAQHLSLSLLRANKR
ncbi:hypothetical protein PHMEG_00012857 [Phytophthora megakarya]|uniref:Uncharacterized protein n=1 Tax=Phytophthora megakarya TaxID=4795 RepID=A0A225W871_9STRA|nr:hypothetical protein PHMEG_00012857 [Phytophthora megakarya]